MNNRTHFQALDRRSFLKSSASFGGALVVGAAWTPAQAAPPLLTVGTRTIEVNKKAAKVFGVHGPDGKPGILATEGNRFSGGLLNDAGEDRKSVV